MQTLKRVPQSLRYVDLFCGIGGFRIGLEQGVRKSQHAARCVFSSDTDPDAQHTYLANFGEQPAGDITTIDAAAIPPHDLLLAGFPCQPFSICGSLKGFEDARGTLFLILPASSAIIAQPSSSLKMSRCWWGISGGRRFSACSRSLRMNWDTPSAIAS